MKRHSTFELISIFVKSVKFGTALSRHLKQTSRGTTRIEFLRRIAGFAQSNITILNVPETGSTVRCSAPRKYLAILKKTADWRGYLRCPTGIGIAKRRLTREFALKLGPPDVRESRLFRLRASKFDEGREGDNARRPAQEMIYEAWNADAKCEPVLGWPNERWKYLISG
jgi:hypothetical protein